MLLDKSSSAQSIFEQLKWIAQNANPNLTGDDMETKTQIMEEKVKCLRIDWGDRPMIIEYENKTEWKSLIDSFIDNIDDYFGELEFHINTVYYTEQELKDLPEWQ